MGKLVPEGEAPFPLALVRRARAEAVDTYVEMSLHVAFEGREQLLEYVLVPLTHELAAQLGQQLQKAALEAELKKAEK